MSMSKKRLLSIVISAVICLSFACTAMAVEKSERYVGDSTVNGSIYQTYYQVDAQTRTEVKKISVSGVLYEKGTIGTWQKVSSCSNSSTTSTCVGSGNFNTKPGKSYRLEYSATFSYSDGRSETNGSNYLASTKSYTYTEILHYYYDNSSYNNPSVGIVKIN